MHPRFLIAIYLLVHSSVFFNHLYSDPSCFVTSADHSHIFVGVPVTSICGAKTFSLRYNIPFYYVPSHMDKYYVYPFFENSTERINDIHTYNQKELAWHDVVNDKFINTYKDKKTHFFVSLHTVLDQIKPEWVDEAKKLVQLQNPPQDLNELPKNCITIAVHIRKGNGGFTHVNDGKMISEQLFEHNRKKIRYLLFKDWRNYPFEPESIRRNDQGYVIKKHNKSDLSTKLFDGELMTSSGSIYSNLDQKWAVKFPPEQYYVDQLNWLIERLKNIPLFVQIFTDDKNPLALIERIQHKINNKNITFHYYNNKKVDKDLETTIIEDLYNISRFSIFIRGQSYFARAAEMMANHPVVIYPVTSQWENLNGKSRNIMDTIIVKADSVGETLFKNNTVQLK